MVDFRIRVVVDPRNAETNTKRVDKALDRTATKADNLRASMARMFAFVGGIAAITSGIRLLAEFGQAMSTVQAVAGATTEQFEELSEAAQQLGISTRFSAAQAAEGMVFLARSGLEVEEVLGTIESTLRLAQAGALDLGSASKITAEVMRGFRLDVEDAERIVDVFALTANSANTDIAQLGQGMKFVGAVAAGLNVDLETATAAMAALADAGLQSTMAGTGLRRILADLESPGTNLQKILKIAGLTVDDVRVSTVGLIPALKRLKEAGVGVGDGFEIFGQRGAASFEILSSNIPKIEEMEERLRGAEGTARRVAEIMDQNLKGALLALRSAWEGLILRIGDAGRESSTLTGIVRELTRFLRFLADNADAVAGVLKALIILLGARGLTGVIVKLTAVIAANPLGILLTALSFGISLLISFKDQIAATSDGLATLGDVFAEAWIVIQEVIAGLRDALIPLLEAVGFAAEDTFGGMEISIRSVLTFMAKASDSIAGLFVGAFEAVATVWDRLPTHFDSIMRLSLKVVRDTTEAIIDTVLAAFQTVGNTLRALWGNISNAIEATSLSLNATIRGDLGSARDNLDTARDSLNLMVGELKLIPKTFEKNRRALASQDLLPAVELTEEALDLGQSVAQAFADGFTETTGAEDLVNRIFDGAERRAADRAAKEAARKAAEGGAITEGADLPGGIPEEGLENTLSTFDKLLQSLVLENDLLEQLTKTRGAAGEALKVEAEAGIIFTDAERKLVQAQLEENLLLKEKNALINDILGPQEQLRVSVKALQELRADEIITQDEFNQKLRELIILANQAGTSLSSGLARGLEQIKIEIQDVGSLLEDTLVNAFHNAEDALVNFIRTGEFEFEEFTNALLDDIARLLVRLLILQTVQAAVGGGPTAQVLGGIQGLQHGGPAQANRPFLVGEQGPELFIPQGAGNVVPADQTAAALAGMGGETTVVQAPAPEVNVQVVNIDDAKKVPAAMDSPEGERVIMNVIQKNKNQVKRTIV